MSSLVMGTSAISMDEWCYVLKELNLQSPGSRGWHRYQIITVIRPKGGALLASGWRERAPFFDLGLGYGLVELRRDLGPARKFPMVPFSIPTGVSDGNGRVECLYTVGEAYDIAEFTRSALFRPPEPPKPADLIQGYHDSFDKKRLRRVKRSTFGERVRVQRS